MLNCVGEKDCFEYRCQNTASKTLGNSPDLEVLYLKIISQVTNVFSFYGLKCNYLNTKCWYNFFASRVLSKWAIS